MNTTCDIIQPERLWRSIQELATYTRHDQPWTRRAFTDLFVESRRWLRAQFEDAGLNVWIDAAGNLTGRREGRRRGLNPIMTGSHCDTVSHGGRYDGIIGVMAGLEVARSLKEHGLVLDHPLEVVDFLSEEPSDYGVSCVGSRAIAGALTSAMLAECDPQGETLLQGISRIGGQPENLDLVKRGPNSVAAFVELHIEQGPVLEKSNLPIGVVSNIVGISRHRIVIEGRSDHAGTTPMELRRDALVGAAAIVSATDERARSFLRGTDYVVATVGHLNVTPNASNAVPGRVDLMMEVRSDNAAILSAFADSILRDLRPRIEVLGLRMRSSQVSHTVPTRCNAAVMQTIEEAAASLGYPSMRMPSGAGHDAVYMAHCGPAAMIFIPCLNGRSHCPEESITSEQLAAGAQVLHRTVLLLDESLKK